MADLNILETQVADLTGTVIRRIHMVFAMAHRHEDGLVTVFQSDVLEGDILEIGSLTVQDTDAPLAAFDNLDIGVGNITKGIVGLAGAKFEGVATRFGDTVVKEYIFRVELTTSRVITLETESIIHRVHKRTRHPNIPTVADIKPVPFTIEPTVVDREEIAVLDPEGKMPSPDRVDILETHIARLDYTETFIGQATGHEIAAPAGAGIDVDMMRIGIQIDVGIVHRPFPFEVHILEPTSIKHRITKVAVSEVLIVALKTLMKKLTRLTGIEFKGIVALLRSQNQGILFDINRHIALEMNRRGEEGAIGEHHPVRLAIAKGRGTGINRIVDRPTIVRLAVALGAKVADIEVLGSYEAT